MCILHSIKNWKKTLICFAIQSHIPSFEYYHALRHISSFCVMLKSDAGNHISSNLSSFKRILYSNISNDTDVAASGPPFGFPSYGPKTFHPNIIASKLSEYRSPLLDVQTFSFIQLYTAVYRCILYIACLDHVSRFCSRSTLSHYLKNKKSLFHVHFPQNVGFTPILFFCVT